MFPRASLCALLNKGFEQRRKFSDQLVFVKWSGNLEKHLGKLMLNNPTSMKVDTMENISYRDISVLTFP